MVMERHHHLQYENFERWWNRGTDKRHAPCSKVKKGDSRPSFTQEDLGFASSGMD
jgi:hypothetical protein